MGVDKAISDQVQQEAAGRETPAGADEGNASTQEAGTPEAEAGLEEDAEAGHARTTGDGPGVRVSGCPGDR